jgi:hypothetical protein
MRSILTLAFAASLSYAAAQTKEFSASVFSELTIAGPFKTTLVKSDRNKVEINFNGIDQDDVEVDSGSGELEIKIKQSIFDFDNYDDRDRNRKYATVTVYYSSTPDDIVLKQGASLRSKETLSVKQMRLESSMGSEMKLDLKVDDLTLESSMGSEVDLTGTASNFELTAKMGSDVDASLLKCLDVRVRASMGASVQVYASRELDASANFGASVTCKGNPTRKKTSGTFGADFH